MTQSTSPKDQPSLLSTVAETIGSSLGAIASNIETARHALVSQVTKPAGKRKLSIKRKKPRKSLAKKSASSSHTRAPGKRKPTQSKKKGARQTGKARH
jgi:hypothetical protein